MCCSSEDAEPPVAVHDTCPGQGPTSHSRDTPQHESISKAAGDRTFNLYCAQTNVAARFCNATLVRCVGRLGPHLALCSQAMLTMSPWSVLSCSGFKQLCFGSWIISMSTSRQASFELFRLVGLPCPLHVFQRFTLCRESNNVFPPLHQLPCLSFKTSCQCRCKSQPARSYQNVSCTWWHRSLHVTDFAVSLTSAYLSDELPGRELCLVAQISANGASHTQIATLLSVPQHI